MELWNRKESVFPVSNGNIRNIVTGSEVTGLLSWWRPVYAPWYRLGNTAHLEGEVSYRRCNLNVLNVTSVRSMTTN